jgi:hypothetical protein
MNYVNFEIQVNYILLPETCQVVASRELDSIRFDATTSSKNNKENDQQQQHAHRTIAMCMSDHSDYRYSRLYMKE